MYIFDYMYTETVQGRHTQMLDNTDSCKHNTYFCDYPQILRTLVPTKVVTLLNHNNTFR